jgi:methylmalonyl-CoA mutase cobalamin-binding domain/chain
LFFSKNEGTWDFATQISKKIILLSAILPIPELISCLRNLGRLDIRVVAGGVIPAKDYEFLKKEGVVAVFGPGTILSEAACEILNQLLQED